MDVLNDDVRLDGSVEQFHFINIYLLHFYYFIEDANN